MSHDELSPNPAALLLKDVPRKEPSEQLMASHGGEWGSRVPLQLPGGFAVPPAKRAGNCPSIGARPAKWRSGLSHPRDANKIACEVLNNLAE